MPGTNCTIFLAILLASGCTGQDSSPPPLTAEVPLLLEEHVEANAAIARLFGGGGDVELSTGELEILRALGYIQ